MNRIYIAFFLSYLFSSPPWWGTASLEKGAILAQAVVGPFVPIAKELPRIGLSVPRAEAPLPQVPMILPEATSNEKIQVVLQGTPRTLTIHGALQRYMEDYLRNHGNPIAAVVL